ncbi:MAG: Txe/YoeB family addiction module toxin [Xenococcaceae cyanobacterium MO_188.B29]|nr:Txe/YoeB family addiction module toxin [Xenococcaceae cyanobacterium MO_188.B29]
MVWTIKFSRNALKDAKKLRSANLTSNVNQLIEILKQNPYQTPYEKLSGNLQGYYSRRINIKHRLVYSIDEENKIIKVVSVWSHYGE